MGEHVNTWRILHGDVRAMLATLPEGSVQCCVTSPPYWGLRDYGVEGQIGLESTLEEFISVMVDVFRGMRRVLKDDGVCWVNLGDSYAGHKGGDPYSGFNSRWSGAESGKQDLANGAYPAMERRGPGLKTKDLCGIPWRVALALQSDGWWLRSDCIWHKPNPMPESVTDRPTKAHEYVFLLTKSASYYYDADAVRTPLAAKTLTTFGTKHREQGNDALGQVKSDNWGRTVPVRKPKMKGQEPAGASMRTVWSIASQPYSGAHFATYPEELARRCIVAGSRTGDTVLDPFCGSGTTGSVAVGHGRNFVGIELNADYIKLARKRIGGTAPLLAQEAT